MKRPLFTRSDIKRLKIAGVIFVIGATLVACGEYPHSEEGQTSTKSGDIVLMPTGFAKIATTCDHGNRIYQTASNDAISVVPNDPTCKEAL
jgi:hypothetical protein